jgi:hypothetical protein
MGQKMDNGKIIPIHIDAYKVINKVHNTQVGHFGVDNTINKIKQQGLYWSSIRADVTQFIRRCPCCQAMSHLKLGIQTHPYVVSAYNPMDRLNIDAIGPLPESEDGNKYIIVIIDCFTRFTQLYPAKAADAESASRALNQHIGIYGIPCEILTDNGSQFNNQVMENLSKLHCYKHNFIQAYSHEENAIVERANKEVMRHLRNIIYETRLFPKWTHYLPMVQRIMNSQVHSSIGTSPGQLLFGNAINLGRLQPDLSVFDTKDPVWLSNHISEMIAAQDIILNKARESQEAKDQHHLKSNKGIADEFDVNEYVMVKYETTDYEAPSKLHPKLRGPYRVVAKISSNIYTCQNLITMKNEDFHIKFLIPFYYDEDKIFVFDIPVGKEEFQYKIRHINRLGKECRYFN